MDASYLPFYDTLIYFGPDLWNVDKTATVKKELKAPSLQRGSRAQVRGAENTSGTNFSEPSTVINSGRDHGSDEHI